MKIFAKGFIEFGSLVIEIQRTTWLKMHRN